MEQSTGVTRAVTKVKERNVDGDIFADIVVTEVPFSRKSLYSSFLLINDRSIYR